ncbi:N-acetyltransferase [Aquimarina sp. RZ0]|uniref:GNAT family N-acetyltransferase n=1 Tax=Aquimarina sp. RZ0 TaxID=2607730 RepID=UPI0011F312F3|nr:GNAT family N-acetyltransferase [Aquimarina sp. RZ0]KAA1246278.1 GNAT family N-acetyltransferase [Aquimarina sp. RZ0]
MDISLIKARNEDKEFLLFLRKSTMVPHLEKADLYLSDEEHISRVEIYFDKSFVISYQEENIGLLKYIETEKIMTILQIQILLQYQGKGIASYILNQLITKAKKLEKEIHLKVLKENPARYLYERLGFNTICD